MPLQLGAVKRACEIGYKGWDKYVWLACSGCGLERWVPLRKGGKPKSDLCRSCAARIKATGRVKEKNPQWKGGRRITNEGYVEVRLYPDDFFYPMAHKSGYVLEHRLVMAKHLGRCLHPWEIVHHKNGVRKDDNRIEVLQLVTDDRHKQITILENKIAELGKRITLLESENVLLKGATSGR